MSLRKRIFNALVEETSFALNILTGPNLSPGLANLIELFGRLEALPVHEVTVDRLDTLIDAIEYLGEKNFTEANRLLAKLIDDIGNDDEAGGGK